MRSVIQIPQAANELCKISCLCPGFCSSGIRVSGVLTVTSCGVSWAFRGCGESGKSRVDTRDWSKENRGGGARMLHLAP